LPSSFAMSNASILLVDGSLDPAGALFAGTGIFASLVLSATLATAGVLIVVGAAVTSVPSARARRRS
jgi:hypothetical protein